MPEMLAKITTKLVGTKFKHCSMDKAQGLDCFTNVIEFLKMKELVVDSQTMFKGNKIFDYEKIYAADPHGTMELAVEYLSTILDAVKVGFEVAGDILIVRFRLKPSDPLGIAIEAGNGSLIIAVIDENIQVVSKKYYRVLKVFRLRKKEE